MVYTPLTRKAMGIAYSAHQGQTDKAGVPYVFHPLHLAEEMTDEVTAAAALLHDVLEDTPVTCNELREAGIPEAVLEALERLTRKEGEPYFAYLDRLRSDPVALAVKRADLRHNSDLTRLETIGEEDLRRVERYRRALEDLAG